MSILEQLEMVVRVESAELPFKVIGCVFSSLSPSSEEYTEAALIHTRRDFSIRREIDSLRESLLFVHSTLDQ